MVSEAVAPNTNNVTKEPTYIVTYAERLKRQTQRLPSYILSTACTRPRLSDYHWQCSESQQFQNPRHAAPRQDVTRRFAQPRMVFKAPDWWWPPRICMERSSTHAIEDRMKMEIKKWTLPVIKSQTSATLSSTLAACALTAAVHQ